MKTIAFDIYGTLINPMALDEVLEEMTGNNYLAFNELWRNKQLEYSFRKAAMKKFNYFGECTRQALDYCDQFFESKLTNEQKEELLGMYRKLPSYEESRACLEAVKDKGIQIAAFSNGRKEDLESLFRHAEIMDLFDLIVSVDEVRTFKPSPEVYQLLTEKCGGEKENIWMVSSNSFDIIGAGFYGLNTIWVQRNPKMVFDPFGYQPSKIVNDLSAVSTLI